MKLSLVITTLLCLAVDGAVAAPGGGLKGIRSRLLRTTFDDEDMDRPSGRRTLKSSRDPCNLSSIVGKYELCYTGYDVADSKAYLTLSEPEEGSGVLNGKYCHDGTTSRDIILVPTSIMEVNKTREIKFHIGTTIPATAEDMHGGYAFDGEYECHDELLSVGYYTFFEGEYYSAMANKNDSLPLDSDGCWIEGAVVVPDVVTTDTPAPAPLDPEPVVEPDDATPAPEPDDEEAKPDEEEPVEEEPEVTPAPVEKPTRAPVAKETPAPVASFANENPVCTKGGSDSGFYCVSSGCTIEDVIEIKKCAGFVTDPCTVENCVCMGGVLSEYTDCAVDDRPASPSEGVALKDCCCGTFPYLCQ